MLAKLIVFFSVFTIVLCGTIAGELTVEVNGIDWQMGGRIEVGLYNSKTGYLKPGYEVYTLSKFIQSRSTLIFVFRDLPEGHYMAAVLHDLNGDSLMETDFLGLPLEGFAFSGVERTRLIPPGFDKVAIFVGKTDRKRTMARMKYRLM